MIVKDSAQVPATLLFLTGGDTTVRGYSYRQIGTVRPDGQIVAGRYLAVASVEWQRPYVYKGKLTDFESVVFVDAGAVADKPAGLSAKVGVGVRRALAKSDRPGAGRRRLWRRTQEAETPPSAGIHLLRCRNRRPPKTPTPSSPDRPAPPRRSPHPPRA